MTTLVSDRPTAGPSPDWAFPAVQRLELDGLDVVAAHLPARPVVQAVVLLDAGATADPVDALGVAALLGDAVVRGAGGRDQHALAVAFERVGAVPGTSVRMDRAEVHVEAPAGLLGEALALTADVVRRPDLDPDEVTNIRDARLDRMRARANEAAWRADRALPGALFAQGSRFAVPSGGTVASLGSIGPEQVTAFHASRWARGRHQLVLVGDLSDVDLTAVAGPLTGDVVDTPTAGTDATPAGAGPRVVLVDVPGSVQSALRIGAPAPTFAALGGAEAALEVAQAAVYGAFSARLNQRLREELGYTYGASGGMARLRDGGWTRVGCSVRTEVTAESAVEAVGVLRAAVADGLTEDEVTQARENLVRKYPVRYDGPGPVAGAIVQRLVHELPDDERDRRLAELREVDAAAASEALRTALAVDDLVVCVAGEGAEISGPLAEADLGPVVEVS